jgi:hypothetical protein
MNDQDHSLSLSDPDRSLVLSHLLVNFLKNLVNLSQFELFECLPAKAGKTMFDLLNSK